MEEKNDRLSMLRRSRVRYQEILASREDMGMKRARSDADITMILAELALTLPENERDLVQEIVALHNWLWSASYEVHLKGGKICHWCLDTVLQLYDVSKRGKWYRVCFECREGMQP